MEVLLGITGKDFTIIAASKAAMRGATVLKAEDDKTRALNPSTLMAFSGEAGDTIQFADYIQANAKLYSMRNETDLSPSALAHFVRGELASSLRSRNPYNVNLLLGGVDPITKKPSLFWLDYLASLAPLPYAAHGYAQYYCLSILDKHHHPEIDLGGLFGSIGNLGKRASQQQQPQQMPTPAPESSVTPAQTPRKSLTLSPTSGTGTPRDLTSSPAFGAMSRTSMDSTRSSVISVQPGRIPPMERRASHQALSSPIGVDGDDRRSHYERWEQVSSTGRASREHSRASSMVGLRSPRSPSVGSSVFATEGLMLPPRPDEMDEEAEDSLLGVSGRRRDRGDTVSAVSENTRTVLGRSGTFGADDQEAMMPAVTGAVAEMEQMETTTTEPVEKEKVPEKKAPRHAPLSESEARVAIELVFAVINELYTLSSAWNIRRTLLTAAKSFLLRPGNPSLLAIQDMMQTSVLDANTDDAGLASYLGKIRESAMPTPEELAQWPAELTADEKEALRIKARRLFIKSGVPEALKGVMGEKASADALGRLFDCLQMEEVARGLIFGILLQAVQIVTR